MKASTVNHNSVNKISFLSIPLNVLGNESICGKKKRSVTVKKNKNSGAQTFLFVSHKN